MTWRPNKASIVIGAILAAPAFAIIWTIHERVTEPFYQGQTVRQWVRQCSGPSRPVPTSPAARIRSILVNGTNLARMIPALASAQSPPLPGFDQAGKEDLPFLIKAANARESVYDRGINFAWTKLRPKLPAAFANKLPTPNTGRRTIRMMAISTLGRLGATDAVPTLTRALKDSEKGIPVAAAAALRMIGPNARAANPTLVGLLKDNDRSIRAAALSALWITGRSDSAVPPALEKVLSGLTSDVRVETADLYWQICRRKDVLVPALIEELREMDPQYFWRAAQLLSEMMPESKSAIPTLIKALRHSENRIRGHAAMALAGIGPPAASAIPALTRLLQDDTAYVREAAAEALKKIAPDQAGPP